VRGARDLLSVAIQYGNAFGQGMQAAALKPADFFGNDDVLYLMEDMATGENPPEHPVGMAAQGRDLHRGRRRDRREGGRRVHRRSLPAPLTEEYDKLQRAGNRDVHDNSKKTTLPIAREIADVYVVGDRKLPWYIDLLNINLGVHTLAEAKRRIQLLVDTFRNQNARVTHNLDFS
jgi:malate synthase